MNEALNKKLAEWAGFKPRTCNFDDTQDHMLYPEKGNKYPSGACLPLPNFPESLDACIEWLVPRLKDIYSVFLEFDAISNDFKCYLGEVDDEGEAIIGETEYGVVPLLLLLCSCAETPALALCLAIEKLIDKGEG